MGDLVELWRYPLKSARGERLDQVDVEADGLAGDRGWACVDVEDETVGSAKHPGRWGALLDVTTRLDDAGRCWVDVGGEACEAGTAEAEALLCEHLGRKVRLTRTPPDGARLHRRLPDEAGMLPDWLPDAAPGQELVTALGGRRFLDFGAVHLVTTGELAGLAAELGRDDVDATWFRPNLVVDAPADPGPGTELTVGDAVLRIQNPTPRCVVPGIRRGAVPPIDRALLGALARTYRRPLPGIGTAACFGTYAEVLRPGGVRVGEFVGAA